MTKQDKKEYLMNEGINGVDPMYDAGWKAGAKSRQPEINELKEINKELQKVLEERR